MSTLYVFRCDEGHEQDRCFALGTAPAEVACDRCIHSARRLLARGAFSTVPGAYNATYRKPA